MPTSVSKSLVSFWFASFPGQIMTSIVILFVRLVHSFKVICWKRFCWVDCLGRFETNCPLETRISSIVFVIHNDLQLITGWGHGTTVLRKWKNIVSPSNLHLNVRYLPKKLNFSTDMTSKWVTYRQRYKKSPDNVKLFLVLASDSRQPTSYECLTKRSQTQEY